MCLVYITRSARWYFNYYGMLIGDGTFANADELRAGYAKFNTIQPTEVR